MFDLLKKINLFGDLSEPELEKILSVSTQRSFAAGEVIFKENDPGEHCYIIVSGSVRISKFIPNIGEEALAVLKPGDYFGEMALIDKHPRSANAIVNEQSELLAIAKPDLENILNSDRDLGYKLLWAFTKTLSKRLRETNEKMAAFLAMSGAF